ncbi:MAG: GIY-YIG nuclease family protein [Xanthobacteraceae bacterium]|nr:GIY-YIG nuclease family protein [Xanthobacteraceae bacterium]
MDRLSSEAVTQGLDSTSDKIRALARAGYLRTEIGKILGIKYQHVRKVLVDAGITDGLQREIAVERSPVTIEVSTTPPKPTSWETLLGGGFRFLGEWVQSPDGDIALDVGAPSDPGVYTFILDDIVVYVGLTQTGFKTRLDGYRRGYERQRTNARVKKLILSALREGKRIKVLIATPDQLEWNGLPINTAAGLESGLIQRIQPEWNVLGIV